MDIVDVIILKLTMTIQGTARLHICQITPCCPLSHPVGQRLCALERRDTFTLYSKYSDGGEPEGITHDIPMFD